MRTTLTRALVGLGLAGAADCPERDNGNNGDDTE
jgi:hypothetical protein